MNDFSDLNAPRRRRTNPALPVGLVAAVVMVGVHLFLLLVLNHNNTGRVVTGDWVAFARRWLQSEGLPEELVVLTEGPSPRNPQTNPRLEIIDLRRGGRS